MTSEQLLAFEIFRKGSPESKRIAQQIIDFIQQHFRLRPSETASGHLVYDPNFILLETIGQKITSVTVNLSGQASLYRGITASNLRIKDGRKGGTKIYITAQDAVPAALKAVEKSWANKLRHSDNRNLASPKPRERRYWMTTHWPAQRDSRREHPSNIYLKDGDEAAGKNVQVGDCVLIYESLGGPTAIEKLADGSERTKPLKKGRQGIVTVCTVAEPFVRRASNEAIAEYVGGAVMNWAWMAKTKDHVSNGFVSRQDLLPILGHSPKYTLRGFGELNSGLSQITEAQNLNLLKIFVSHPTAKPLAPKGEEPPKGGWSEGVGEGPEHKKLKEYIAAHPSLVLGEPGVILDKIEFSFRTGDRADIALIDQTGRFIGLEVEISQNDLQWEGLLQAIKYRHMLALVKGVSFEECRGVLAAYSLSEKIIELCRRYKVEPIIVPREAVEKWKPS